MLQPARAVRDSGIAGVILTDAQLDHATGLFMLRESTMPLSLWCTASAYLDLTNGNPVIRVLNHYCGVKHRVIAPRRTFCVDAMEIDFLPVALSSKAPPYSPHRETPHDDDNIALRIVDRKSGGSLFYAPGLGAMSEAVWQGLFTSECVLVDGTFWTDDEMVRLGLSKKSARDIGHLPLSGPEGMIEWLGKLPGATRKILVHVNNTNPILDEDSAERAMLANRNIEVGYDGMEIEL
jgi:pyrroloquinoline quinone biosynthesis protein B